MNIDKDIVDSLRGLYFGSIQDKYKAAVFRAYRDFNRTIDFPASIKELAKKEQKVEEHRRTVLKSRIVELMRTEILRLHAIEPIDKESFDLWHKALCNNILSIYNDAGVFAFSYGQSQKWINMTIKYLYLLQEDSFEREFPYLHVPIDNYIMDIAQSSFGMVKPKVAWSSWTYRQYIDYQTELQSHIIDESPLRWEFHSWLTAAHRKGE